MAKKNGKWSLKIQFGVNNIECINFTKKKIIKNILIIDGQPGCGKTLFNRIFNSAIDIEIYRYSSEIENICIIL